MEIRPLTTGLHSKYDEYVRNHPKSLLYHSLKYKDFLEAVLDCKPHYLVAIMDGEIVGVLPVMITNGSLGKVVNSLPFYGSNGGLLCESADAAEKLFDAFESFLMENEVASSTVIDNPLDQTYEYHKLQANELDYRIGQFSRIAGNFEDMENLMQLFHTKTRNTIRKSKKSGVKVTEENGAFQFLEETHRENMASIGGLAKSPKFFRAVRDIFEADRDYKIYVARSEGKPIAALLVFYFNGCVEYYTPVVVKEYRHLQARSLIICTAMFEAAQRNFIWWNWGGTWASQDGVYQFKSRWGTSDFRYEYHINIRNSAIYKASRKTLLEEYPGFYVVPFNKLK